MQINSIWSLWPNQPAISYRTYPENYIIIMVIMIIHVKDQQKPNHTSGKSYQVNRGQNINMWITLEIEISRKTVLIILMAVMHFFTFYKHYQLIGSFSPTVAALSFPSWLQNRATGSGPCPNDAHGCRKGKPEPGSLWPECPSSVLAIVWPLGAAALLNAIKQPGLATPLVVRLLLLVNELKTVSVTPPLFVIPRRQGEARPLAGLWGVGSLTHRSALLLRRWVSSWCCSRLSVQSSCGCRWIFMCALRDLIL